jgi:putative bacteriocin precursor
MRKLGKNVKPVKETVEAYYPACPGDVWCYANCKGESSWQSYAYQYGTIHAWN